MARVPGGFGVNDVMGVGSRSRAVSLGDVREQPVQRMGFDWVYTNYGYETTSPGGTKIRITGPHKGNEAGSRGGKYWSIEDTEGKNVKGIDEYQPTLRDAKRVAEERVPRHDESEEKLRVAHEETQRKVAQREERRRQRESRMDLNTAMAGGGQESLPGLSPEEIQYDINRRGIDEARRILEEARRRAEEKAKQPRPAGPAPQQGPPIPPRPDQLDAIRYALLAAGVGGAGMGAMRTFGGGGILGGLGSGMSLR